MADLLNARGKSKKVVLPPGWVERVSRKHPDRPFFFNESTGERSWSPPLKQDDKRKSQGRKSKKRKTDDLDSDEFSDASPSVAQRVLDEIISRPKLKAKGSRNATIPREETVVADTPAMRLYREKLAQRKAAADSKKSASKSTKKVEPAAALQKSPPATPTRRNGRSSSISSSTSTTVSGCSGVSNATSMGTKIRSIASASKVASPSKQADAAGPDVAEKSKKIPRVDVTRLHITKGVVRQSFKKNMANERLEKLRKRLGLQKDKHPLVRRVNEPPFDDNPDGEPQKKNRVQASARLENIRLEQQMSEEECARNKSILEQINSSDSYCEEMEWEPIEDDKIVSEIHTARIKLCENPPETLSVISHNVLKTSNLPEEKNAVYVVVDTNVFLSNLSFIEEVRDSNSHMYGRPFIVIPWTVLQELDYIKDDKNNIRSEALKFKARTAIKFLNQHFSAKHPRFLGQTPADVEKNKTKFMIECPDDEILQTCLQIRESSKLPIVKMPVLLSYDKNLCTKAMMHDIPILGRDDPLEKIYYLKAAETSQFLSNSLHAHMEEKQDENYSTIQEELTAAEDIMEEAKAILKSVFSQVVATEMESLFGNGWEKYVIIRPPWSVVTVLKCALKHWMAAVSESFDRRLEPTIRDLQLCITNIPEGGRKLADVKIFLDKCCDVFQSLNANKYPVFKKKTISQIHELIQKCSDQMEEINGVRFLESVGLVEESEEETRASRAFKIFEEIYSFARDTCGLASDALGMQCAFAYNKFHPLLTPQRALQKQEIVGVNVNKLLQVLGVVLSNNYETTCPDEKIIFSLYEVLVNFSVLPDLNIEEFSKLAPADLFCCIKLKRSKLEKGYDQLHELAVHFCRMAKDQCK